ncbi:MAG: hypothetical protein WC701_13730 [Kiritimatiellales bacterium]|jgi:hypothetical protein
MSIQTPSNLSNSVRTQYIANYIDGAYGMRVYDQLAVPFPGISAAEVMKGSSVSYPFLSGMTPSTETIPQDHDVTPQILRDAVGTFTPTSRWGALQWHEATDMQVYTDYGQKRFKKLGENQMESIELLALSAVAGGSWYERYTARASLDAGTAAHRASDSIFRKMQGMMLTMKVPGFINSAGEANTWGAIMHPFPFHDICESGNVDAIGLYQDAGIHLNFEAAKIGPFRLVVTPYAKVFGGAGLDNGTAVATTLASAASALGTTIVTAADVAANAAAGMFWTIGTEETSTTVYPTNERVKVVSAVSTTITVIGEGENGGLRFDHAAGEAVRNADSVYTIVFGGPGSLVKAFDPAIGEYGEVVGPKKFGMLDQFASIGWKYYGGYGRITENRIVRGEFSTSYEA